MKMNNNNGENQHNTVGNSSPVVHYLMHPAGIKQEPTYSYLSSMLSSKCVADRLHGRVIAVSSSSSGMFDENNVSSHRQHFVEKELDGLGYSLSNACHR
jgi:hypothetical protein